MMDYDCVCDYDYSYSVFKTREVKAARKPYRCCECGNEVAVGDPYLYVFGICEGQKDTYRLCSYCNAMKQYVQAHLPCFCWYWGSEGEMTSQMLDAVWDYKHEVPGMWIEFGRLYLKATKPEWRNKGR